MTHMIDVMGKEDGARQFFRKHESPRLITLLIQREQKDGTKSYLRVPVDDTWYAFKIIPKTNHFTFVNEIEYRTKMCLGPNDEGETLGGDGDLGGDEQRGSNDQKDMGGRSDRSDTPMEGSADTDPLVPHAKRKGPLRFSDTIMASDRADTEAADAPKRR